MLFLFMCFLFGRSKKKTLMTKSFRAGPYRLHVMHLGMNYIWMTLRLVQGLECATAVNKWQFFSNKCVRCLKRRFVDGA